jgi:hypothetical protein
VEPKVVFEGIQTGHDGFVLEEEEARTIVSADPRNRQYIKPFINGSDLLSGKYLTAPQFVVDMSELDLLQASALPDLLAIPQARVLPDWQMDAAKENEELGRDRGEHQNRIDRWWALKRPRGDLQQALRKLPRYIACSAVMKRPTFVFLASAFLPTNALKVFAFADDYSFGILQSHAHWLWFVTKCSKLKADFRYTPETVFETFPWPQTPNEKVILAVAEAGKEIRRIRDSALTTFKGGLRALYRTLELPGLNPLKTAHANLDDAVLNAYGFNSRKDLLAQILALNGAVATSIGRNERVTAPGTPVTIKNPATLLTNDCIKPLEI